MASGGGCKYEIVLDYDKLDYFRAKSAFKLRVFWCLGDQENLLFSHASLCQAFFYTNELITRLAEFICDVVTTL